MAPTIPKLRVPIDFGPTFVPEINVITTPRFTSPMPWPLWAIYTDTGTSSRSRVADPTSLLGDYAAEVVAVGLGPGSISMFYFTGTAEQSIEPGQRAYIRGRIKWVSGSWDQTSVMGIEVRWAADNAYNGEAYVASIAGSNIEQGEWVDLEAVSPVAPPDSDAVGMGFYVTAPTSGSGHAATFHADAAMVLVDVPDGFSTAYFDGDRGGKWLGAPYESRSEQRGPLRAGAVVEQDSDDELAQCVYALLATPLGSRLEDPAYGVEDATFEQLPVNLDLWRTAIAEYEPRAEVATEQQLVELVDEIKVRVGVA